MGKSPAFQEWSGRFQPEVWHETPASDAGDVGVVVQSRLGIELFAARLRRPEPAAWTEGAESQLLATAAINTQDVALPRDVALLTARRTVGLDSNEVHAIRPVVDLGSDPPALSWELELATGELLRRFLVSSPNDIQQISEAHLSVFQHAAGAPPPVDDSLAENECHHPSEWQALAQQIAGTAATPADKALRVFEHVRGRMRYDATIAGINDFTFSDNLVIRLNGWAGVCDEFAVVTITLLRALGIPAALKILRWTLSGPMAHACVEWLDGNTWRHMDTSKNVWDRRWHYRTNYGVQADVRVIDAQEPLDTRSIHPAWGTPDPPGDQRFHPFRDFVLHPDMVGERRAEYSY
jgi:hypothetical protein